MTVLETGKFEKKKEKNDVNVVEHDCACTDIRCYKKLGGKKAFGGDDDTE